MKTLSFMQVSGSSDFAVPEKQATQNDETKQYWTEMDLRHGYLQQDRINLKSQNKFKS